MGIVINVRAEELESANFDRIVRLALEIVYVRKSPFDIIKVVKDGPYDVDLEGDEGDREYWKRDGRSMTELYAIRAGLGTADASGVVCVQSPIPGLVSLCQSLAENNNRVPGVDGGALYKRGKIPSYALSLSVLPARASEMVGMLVKAVAASLEDAHPVAALIAADDGRWDGIEAALAAEGRRTYEEARDVARALEQGRYDRGETFPLAKASGAQAPMGIAIVTENSQLMKHLWSAIKARRPAFNVATSIVTHPKNSRIAVMCSNEYPVDIGPVAKALAKRFPETEFNVNLKRGTIVWDRRSKTPGPTAEQMQEVVAEHLSFRIERKADQAPRLGATLGDLVRQRNDQKNR